MGRRTGAPLSTRFPQADRAARSRWGIVGIAVHDTKTGEVWQNEFAHIPIRSASIIKAAILLAFLDAKKGNPASLTEKERADAEAMIRRSDNNATTRFWKALGGGRVMDWMHRACGTRDARVAPENSAWWGYSLVTTADMATILAGAAAHRLVTPVACDYLLSEMRQVDPTQRWGVPEGSPTPARVAVKNGWYGEEDEKVWRIHSLGVVPVGDDPNRLVVAILTRYPFALGMKYGQDTCRLVATEIIRNFPS